MKRFFLWGISTLFLALILVGGVFFYIQGQLSPLPETSETPASPEMPATTTPPEDEGGATGEATSPPLSETLAEPVPLRDLPLSESQRSLFETAGVDVETYEITPEAIACAEEKIGVDRVRAIMEGDSPSFTEGVALSGCL